MRVLVEIRGGCFVAAYVEEGEDSVVVCDMDDTFPDGYRACQYLKANRKNLIELKEIQI